VNRSWWRCLTAASVDGGLVAAAVRIRDEAAEHADALDELLAAAGFDDT